MKIRDERHHKNGSSFSILLLLLPVLCCGGIVLIAGIGAAGLAAIMAFITNPLVQAGAVGLLAVALVALWRRRKRLSSPQSQAIPAAEPVHDQVE